MTISSKVFEEGLISKRDFRKAQENDVQLTEAIRDNRLKVIEVDGVLCVNKNRGGRGSKRESVRPILPEKLLRWHAISMHLDPSSFHYSSAQTVRRIKQQFYILNDSVVRDEIGRYYIGQIATPHQSTRHKIGL